MGDGVPDDVALEPGLLRAALADLDHRLEPGHALASRLQAGVGVVDVGLLSSKFGMRAQGSETSPGSGEPPFWGMGHASGPLTLNSP
jgi:hypothetical protein